mgnify:CR=1 FL=1
MYSSDRVVFQSKVDRSLLKQFRDVQQRNGRTNRFMLEKYMELVIEEDKKKEFRNEDKII